MQNTEITIPVVLRTAATRATRSRLQLQVPPALHLLQHPVILPHKVTTKVDIISKVRGGNSKAMETTEPLVTRRRTPSKVVWILVYSMYLGKIHLYYEYYGGR